MRTTCGYPKTRAKASVSSRRIKECSSVREPLARTQKLLKFQMMARLSLVMACYIGIIKLYNLHLCGMTADVVVSDLCFNKQNRLKSRSPNHRNACLFVTGCNRDQFCIIQSTKDLLLPATIPCGNSTLTAIRTLLEFDSTDGLLVKLFGIEGLIL